jgi:hypothetical protein
MLESDRVIGKAIAGNKMQAFVLDFQNLENPY